MAASATAPSDFLSQSARLEITDQLTRILASPWFRSSSRCSQLLRHVVELSMHGQSERLKERQIAIEAFHRKPSYDNSADPVVRVVAGEVRKRLAQYYSSAENGRQLRIELPVGSYVPVFYLTAPADPVETVGPEGKAAVESLLHTDCPERTENSPTTALSGRAPSSWVAALICTTALLALAAAGGWVASRFGSRPSGFSVFWAPVFASPRPPLISVGELRARELTFTPDPQRVDVPGGFTLMGKNEGAGSIPVERIAYLEAAARIASVFGAKGRPFDILAQSQTTFADFSGRPIVLVGSYDNDWAIGISEGKRFEFHSDLARGLKWISDRNRPDQQIGTMQISSPEPATYDAFSVVIRQSGRLSHQPHVLVAGVGDEGTVAAAEFVTNPKYLDDFAERAPRGWSQKNIEFLIQTRVIEGVVGIPTVIDYSIW